MDNFTKMTELLFCVRTAYAERDTENKRLNATVTRLRKERDYYKQQCCEHYEALATTEKSSYEKAVMDDDTPWSDIREEMRDELQDGMDQYTQGLVNDAVEEKFTKMGLADTPTTASTCLSNTPDEPVTAAENREVAAAEETVPAAAEENTPASVDWVAELDTVLETAAITEGTKEACKKTWDRVAGEVRTWEDTAKLLEHINDKLESESYGQSSRKTHYGQVASAFKWLRKEKKELFPFHFNDLPAWRRFNSKWEELKSKVNAETKHKTPSKGAVMACLMVPGKNRCLTTEMLQEELDKRLAESVCHEKNTEHRLKTMFLSFYAYHGFRTEDWNVALKRDSKVYSKEEIQVADDGTHGYVSLGNGNITLWSGKCVKHFPERVVPLHSKVLCAIRNLHDFADGWDGQWLCMKERGAIKNLPKAMRDRFSRKVPKKKNDADYSPTYTGIFSELFDGWKGVPIGEVLRKLWEVHIRRHRDPHGDEVKRLSEGCGHSVETAEKFYMEFKGVYELNDKLDVTIEALD